MNYDEMTATLSSEGNLPLKKETLMYKHYPRHVQSEEKGDPRAGGHEVQVCVI